jgi:tetratricopeptide (TPR) repeat protein
MPLALAVAQSVAAPPPTIQHMGPVQQRPGATVMAPGLLAADVKSGIWVSPPPSDPQVRALIREGEVALGENRLREAYSAYRDVLARVNQFEDPVTYAWMLIQLGFTDLQAGNVTAAEAHFAEAQPLLEGRLANTTQMINALKVGQAGAAKVRGQTERVKRLVQEIHQKFPPAITPADELHYLSRARMGAYLWLVGLLQAAQPYLRAAVELQDTHPDIAPDMAAGMSLQFAALLDKLLAGQQGNFGPDGKPANEPSEIEHYAKHTIDLLGGPDKATGLNAEVACYLLGQEQIFRRAWKEATVSLQHAIEIGRRRSPLSVPLLMEYTQLAEAFAGQNQYAEAIKPLDEVIALDRTLLPDAQVHLARNLQRKGEFQCGSRQCVAGLANVKEAEALFSAASSPEGLAMNRYRLGAILQVSGTLSDALKANEAAHQISQQIPGDPLNGLLHQQRGEILLAQHQPAAAIQEFEAALSIFVRDKVNGQPAVIEMQAYEAAAWYEQGDHAAALIQASDQVGFYEQGGWDWRLGIAAAARVVGLMALERNETASGLDSLDRAWTLRSHEMPGGEVTITQGWELVEALRKVHGADSTQADAVLERLYALLGNSPELPSALRVKIATAWAQVLRHRGQADLAAAVEGRQ